MAIWITRLVLLAVSAWLGWAAGQYEFGLVPRRGSAIAPPHTLLFFFGLAGLGVGGFLYSFVPTRRSRRMAATVVVLIFCLIWMSLSLMLIGFVSWLDFLLVAAGCFVIPVTCVTALWLEGGRFPTDTGNPETTRRRGQVFTAGAILAVILT